MILHQKLKGYINAHKHQAVSHTSKSHTTTTENIYNRWKLNGKFNEVMSLWY